MTNTEVLVYVRARLRALNDRRTYNEWDEGMKGGAKTELEELEAKLVEDEEGDILSEGTPVSWRAGDNRCFAGFITANGYNKDHDTYEVHVTVPNRSYGTIWQIEASKLTC